MTLLSEKIATDPEFEQLLTRLARRYVWWQTADITLRRPEFVVSQVMDMGDYADVQEVTKQLTDACLREVLESAEIGQFNDRSWTYWHYRLGLPASEAVPPMPRRRLE